MPLQIQAEVSPFSKGGLLKPCLSTLLKLAGATGRSPLQQTQIVLPLKNFTLQNNLKRLTFLLNTLALDSKITP
jgi:hypothetical protein